MSKLNAIQINHSFDWDRDEQVDDFLASIENDIEVVYIDSNLATVYTKMTRDELQKAGNDFGLSSFIMGVSNL